MSKPRKNNKYILFTAENNFAPSFLFCQVSAKHNLQAYKQPYENKQKNTFNECFYWERN